MGDGGNSLKRSLLAARIKAGDESARPLLEALAGAEAPDARQAIASIGQLQTGPRTPQEPAAEPAAVAAAEDDPPGDDPEN